VLAILAPYCAGYLVPSGEEFQDFEGGTLSASGNYAYHFQDAPIDHWAHRYIGWAVYEGIITGYTCGGVTSPPCIPPENRPYFRPQNGATRAQFSKMAVLGLSLPINIAGGPHFTDIYPGGPHGDLYEFVETLYNTIINGERAITGYPCGSVPEEPCDSQNRPYFRPGNSITRGQISQIVARTATYQNWFSASPYYEGQGPDFADTIGNTFYAHIQKLYNIGAVQYRKETRLDLFDKGGEYFPHAPATRAQIAMFIHELVYASIPPP